MTSSSLVLLAQSEGVADSQLAEHLWQDGYEVIVAFPILDLLDLAGQYPEALVVLDRIQPAQHSLVLSHLLRTRPKTAYTPLLVVATNGSEEDAVIGLEEGADEYVRSPYSWPELRARIRALLRRCSRGPTSLGEGQGRFLDSGDLYIDLTGRVVIDSCQQIILPTRLFDLLVYLVRHRGLVLTREHLLEQVWGESGLPPQCRTIRMVDVYIYKLRRWLEKDPTHPERIQTVPGFGYRFNG